MFYRKKVWESDLLKFREFSYKQIGKDYKSELTVCYYHVTYEFQSESAVAWMSRNSLLEADAISEV